MKNFKGRWITALKILGLGVIMVVIGAGFSHRGASAENRVNPSNVPAKGVSSAAGTDSFNIEVNIRYAIELDDKVKEVNPNIIKATRQAIFDFDCSNARFSHYNGYTVNNDVYIFAVKQISPKKWEVRFWEKPMGAKVYNQEGYSFATVEQENSGSFKGYIINPGGPNISVGETF